MESPRDSISADVGRLRLVLAALFLSGVASIVNQVVWQRALKVFLGGSESISSMVVVLVFMLGLGLGSGLAGSRAARIAHPLRAFGWVETALFGVNALVTLLLSLDLSDSVFAAERVALAAQIPLRVVYGVASLVLLLPPTSLMGATLPLAAEACQRQLGASESRLITVLLALNTVGACIGAIGSSFLLLPYFGQRTALSVAALFNLFAGLVVLLLARSVASSATTASTDARAPSAAPRRGFSLEEKLGFVLGFLSLGYEMFLLRVVSLAHEPRPYTFAFTLLFFLLFWSLGVASSDRLGRRPIVVLLLTAVAIASMPTLYGIDRWESKLELYRGGLAYFLPCIGFGAMYGTLVARAASQWGRDVGRFYAGNTIGSCLGILFFSLVGYEIVQSWNAYLISAGVVGVALSSSAGSGSIDSPGPSRSRSLARVAIALGAVASIVVGLRTPYSEARGIRTFWGRDGVIEVDHAGSVWIDGLWHSKLTDGRSHVGNPYNWMMVVAAVLAHGDTPITDGLVVGNGLGITAATLAKRGGVEVDAYEINRTFAQVAALYPENTLGATGDSRIHVRWQDGRSGLALDAKRYDVIISAPLHLRASGSSNLLSREYLELARSRLKPGGVITLYSQEGKPEQAELVRATVQSVFPHVQTFLKGLLTVASDSPIEITRDSIRASLARRDPLAQEMLAIDRMLRRRGEAGLYAWFDARRLLVRESPYLVTDDHPLVEYPDVVARLLNRVDAGAAVDRDSPWQPVR